MRSCNKDNVRVVKVLKLITASGRSTPGEWSWSRWRTDRKNDGVVFFKASCGRHKKTLKVKSVVCQVSQEWICAFSSLILISLGYSMTLSRRKISAILLASFSCSITPCNTLQHSVGTCFTILLRQEWLFEIYFSKYSHALSIRLCLCNFYVYGWFFFCVCVCVLNWSIYIILYPLTNFILC